MELAVKSHHNRLVRLDNIAYKIGQAAQMTGMCPKDKEKYFYGITAINREILINQYQGVFSARADKKLIGEAVDNVLRTAKYPFVLRITKESAAEWSGLKEGDFFKAINEIKITENDEALHKTLEQFDMKSKKGDPLELLMERDGAEIKIKVDPVKICFNPIFELDTTEVQAYADGEKVLIGKGIMRFFPLDSELAVIVAHEVAHNLMKHIEAKIANSMVGMLFDLAAAAYGVNTQSAFTNAARNIYSKEFEAEADYVGLYLLALSDYPIENSADIWREFAAEFPSSSYSSTHPSYADRYLAIKKTVKEINLKKLSGENLLPEMKDR